MRSAMILSRVRLQMTGLLLLLAAASQQPVEEVAAAAYLASSGKTGDVWRLGEQGCNNNDARWHRTVKLQTLRVLIHKADKGISRTCMHTAVDCRLALSFSAIQNQWAIVDKAEFDREAIHLNKRRACWSQSPQWMVLAVVAPFRAFMQCTWRMMERFWQMQQVAYWIRRHIKS